MSLGTPVLGGTEQHAIIGVGLYRMARSFGACYLESRSLLIEQLFRGTSIFHDKFLPRSDHRAVGRRTRQSVATREGSGKNLSEKRIAIVFGLTEGRDEIEPSIIVRRFA